MQQLGALQTLSPLRFGTGGIRAIMGPDNDQLNDGTVASITQAVAVWLGGEEGQTVVVARDCRMHGASFMRTVAEVLAANDIHVILLPGVQPTPVLCLAIQKLKCTAGIILTASHNACEYNGYKVYDSRGCQLTPRAAATIQGALDGRQPIRRTPLDRVWKAGLVSVAGEAVFEYYVDRVRRLSPCGSVGTFQIRIVYTPLNGTGGVLLTRLLRAQGFGDVVVVPEQAEPNGRFPTCPEPNPQKQAAMATGMELCEDVCADIVLANDPDADRVGVAVLHEGVCRQLSGDEVSLLLFEWLCRTRAEQGLSVSGMIAYTTVASTPLLDAIAKRWGVWLRRTLTGFKYIGEQMCQLEETGELDRFLLGMEESCGYLLDATLRDKDGISAALAVAVMARWYKERGLTLVDALGRIYESYGWCVGTQICVQAGRNQAVQVMDRLRSNRPNAIAECRVTQMLDFSESVPMPSTYPDDRVERLPSADVIELRLEEGRAVIRPSGTEPQIKAYVFAQKESEEEARALLDSLGDAMHRMLAREA